MTRVEKFRRLVLCARAKRQRTIWPRGNPSRSPSRACDPADQARRHRTRRQREASQFTRSSTSCEATTHRAQDRATQHAVQSARVVRRRYGIFAHAGDRADAAQRQLLGDPASSTDRCLTFTAVTGGLFSPPSTFSTIHRPAGGDANSGGGSLSIGSELIGRSRDLAPVTEAAWAKIRWRGRSSTSRQAPGGRVTQRSGALSPRRSHRPADRCQAPTNGVIISPAGQQTLDRLRVLGTCPFNEIDDVERRL